MFKMASIFGGALTQSAIKISEGGQSGGTWDFSGESISGSLALKRDVSSYFAALDTSSQINAALG